MLAVSVAAVPMKFPIQNKLRFPFPGLSVEKDIFSEVNQGKIIPPKAV